MKTIKITGYEIDVKESLTFGEREDLQKEMLKNGKIVGKTVDIDPATLVDSKYPMLEKYISQIRKIEEGKDAVVIPFSRDWLRALPEADGQKVIDEAGIYPTETEKKNG